MYIQGVYLEFVDVVSFFLFLSFGGKERRKQLTLILLTVLVARVHFYFRREKKGVMKLSQLKTTKSNKSVNCSILF